MRRVLIFSIILMISLTIYAFLGIARAEVEFSADIVIVPKGDEPMNGKIFVKGDWIRLETSDEDGPQVTIVRPDKKVTWILSPEDKEYEEIPYMSMNKTFEEWTAEKEKNSKFIGDETISGMHCKKYQAMEDGEKTIYWIAKEFPFPLKIEDPDLTTEYKNIKMGKVQDSLFELPEGWGKKYAPNVPPED